MQYFILFVVGAVMLGAGAMLSPAWPTREPRIGVAATFSLALVVGGAVWWAEVFGWSTLVIDYLLFALVSFVVLGGTLSSAHARAEAQGEVLDDAEQGWPGPQDLAFFALVAVWATLPLILLHLPAGTEAQATAFLALTARDGEQFTTLAPYYPDSSGLSIPGFQALTAYLSAQLGQSVPLIQMAVGSVTAYLCVWVAYDLGGEIQNKRLGRAMAVTVLASLSVAGLLVNGFYPQLMATLFALAFLLYALRVARHGLLLDVVAAGLMLGAVLYVSPTLFALMLPAYVLWMLWYTSFAPLREKEQGHNWRWLGVFAVLLFGTGPWLLNNTAWLSRLFTQPAAQVADVSILLTHHGIGLVLAAVFGVVIAWRSDERETRPIVVLCLLLLAALSFGFIGLTEGTLTLWIGATIPLTILAGYSVLWLYEHLPHALRQTGRRYVYGLLLLIFAGMIGLVLLLPTVRDLASNAAQGGILASADDVAVMRWAAQNTADDALILNHPTLGGWAAALTERRVVYLPDLPLFDVAQPAGESLRSFWQSVDVDLLRAAGITHVLLPDARNEWYFGAAVSVPDTLTGLTQIFQQGEAALYAVPERPD